MAQVLESIPPSKTKRLGMQPHLWRCGNPNCLKIISDVDQKTIPKKYCSDECRQAINRGKLKTREYVKSQRYDKTSTKPTWVKCDGCGDDTLPLVADTTKNKIRYHFKVPIRYCPKCKIVKPLEPMEVRPVA